MLYLPTFGKFIRGQIDINTPYIERLGANPLRTWCMKFWSGGLQIQTSRVPPRGFFFVDWNDLKCIYQPFQCSPQQAVVGAVCHWLPLPVASPRWWCSRKPPLSRQSPFPVWRMLSTSLNARRYNCLSAGARKAIAATAFRWSFFNLQWVPWPCPAPNFRRYEFPPKGMQHLN